jgi:hypothetical protein
MVTDKQLASAIRSIGGSGEPFSSAALRAHLGMTTEDRRTLTRFNAVLRAYCKVNGHTLERIGKNRYRLLESESDVGECRPLRRVVIRITRTPLAVETEPRVFWLWAVFAKLGLLLQGTVGLGAGREPAAHVSATSLGGE